MSAPSLACSTQAPNGIWLGDAFDLVHDLASTSVDLIITSPPYWGLRSYGLDHNDDVAQAWRNAGCDASRTPPYPWYRDNGGMLGREPYPDWYVAHLVEFFTRAQAALKPGGNLWVNLGDTYFARWSSIRDGGRQGLNGARARRRTPSGGYLHDKQLLLIPARFAIAMQDAGWILRNDLVWAKPSVLPRPEADRLRLSHEHWFHFVKRQPRGRPHYYYDLEACESGALDVVMHPTAPGNDGHSATFPPELVRRRIESSCPPGGQVLDPFCGTGRAVVEAISSGRQGLGFEICPEFYKAASVAVTATVMKESASGKKRTKQSSPRKRQARPNR